MPAVVQAPMPDTDACVVLCTFPSHDKAAEVARTLVGAKLAACASLVPTVTSIYAWNGAIESAQETLAIIKTTGDRVEALTTQIVELHPYDVPEVIVLPILEGHAPYLAWLVESTRA